MALIICPRCGNKVSDKAKSCMRCGMPVAEMIIKGETPVASPEPEGNPISAPEIPKTPAVSVAPKEEPLPKKNTVTAEPKKSNSGLIVGVILALLLIGGGIGGWYYYDKVYLPEKIDREAPRYYTMTNVILRSTKVADVDYNNLASLSFGTELLMYDKGEEWSRVKVAPKKKGEKPLIGYIKNYYILDKPDFFLLNSIFGDDNSRDVINTTKCRRAVLDYFKEHGYVGKISSEILKEAGITTVPNTENQWQIFSKTAKSKPNTTYFAKVIRKDSKYMDCFVIIKNIETGQQKTLVFFYDDDETSHFYGEFAAPDEGYIKRAIMYNSDVEGYDLCIEYSNGNKVSELERDYLY